MRYLSNFISNIKLLFMRSLSDNLGRNSHRDIYNWLMKVEHGVNSNKCLLNGMYPRHHKNIERIEKLENSVKANYNDILKDRIKIEKDIEDLKTDTVTIFKYAYNTRDLINSVEESRVTPLEKDIKDIKYLVNSNISLSYIRNSLNNNAKDIESLEKSVKNNFERLQRRKSHSMLNLKRNQRIEKDIKGIFDYLSPLTKHNVFKDVVAHISRIKDK